MRGALFLWRRVSSNDKIIEKVLLDGKRGYYGE